MLRFLQSIKKYQKGHQPLYRFSLVVLFWAIADGVFSFLIPIYMQESLQNLFLMGIIFASSSFFGLLLDFFLGSEQKGRTFKPYFGFSVVLALLTYMLAFKAESPWTFLIIMALWGIYYDSMNFTIVDFVNRFSKKWEHAQSSGVVQMFFSFGVFLGPLLLAYLLLPGRSALGISIMAIIASFWLFYFYFRQEKSLPEPPSKKLSFKKELATWIRVSKKAYPVLICRFLIAVWDSLVWSMGPILLLSIFKNRAALIMSCFILPSVIFQGYAGRLADKKGKKRFVILGLSLAGLFLALFNLIDNLAIKVLMVLASAIGSSLVWPAVDGLLVDVINKFKEVEEEVAGLRGLSFNLAYIITPITAGLMGKYLGLSNTFIIFGVFLFISALGIKIFWRK